MERAHEMYLYAAQPDHVLPMLNDCNPNPTDPAPLLRRAAEAFERDDFLWGGTHGAEGTRARPHARTPGPRRAIT